MRAGDGLCTPTGANPVQEPERNHCLQDAYEPSEAKEADSVSARRRTRGSSQKCARPIVLCFQNCCNSSSGKSAGASWVSRDSYTSPG